MKLTAYNANGSRILKGWHIQNEQGHRVASIDGSTLSPEKEYELAQLIAAAPDLAEALATLVQLYVANPGTKQEFITCITPPSASAMTEEMRIQDPLWSAFDKARAALQKAGVTL